jgi:hypothetical protein
VATRLVPRSYIMVCSSRDFCPATLRVPSPPGCPLTLSLGLGGLRGRSTCRVSGRPGLLGRAGTDHQVPGGAEARQGPEEAAEGLYGVRQGWGSCEQR